MSCNVLDGLKGCLDSTLGIRDDLGIILHKVFIVKRTRQETDPDLDGFGGSDPVDIIETNILPSPRIVDYAHDLRLKEAGQVKAGDLMLKQISKNAFPLRSIVDCSINDGEGNNIERYYLVNDELYTVIHVKEQYLWWDVHIRKHSDIRTYFA